MAMNRTYRPDIDGLRTLAVLPVVFYHLKVRGITGGFVGVDIFFVISGFLITGLIYSDIQADRYSIVQFYVRRARRIFPALFFMCAVCTVAVLAIYLPDEVAAYKSSLASATLFVSNLYFYFTENYFAAAADTKPLLHTWSLAVEEQFYIFFPLILLLSHRLFLKHQKPVIAAIAIASLALSIWLVQANPPAAFYLIQARAWELMIGALLAINAIPPIRSKTLAELVGGIGIVLIGGSVFLLNDSTPFPGLAALPPCLGAACVIHSGTHCRTWTVRLLSLVPVRFIGLISYSLYLWHWPITVFTLNYWNPLTKTVKIGAFALSLALAAFSWRFVEQPWRRKPYRIGSFGILAGSGATMAILVLVAYATGPISNALWKIPDSAQRILDLQRTGGVAFTGKSCFLSSHRDDLDLYDRENCLKWSDTQPNLLILGDSMAHDFVAGFKSNFPDQNLLQALSSGCKPVSGGTGLHRCTTLMQSMFDDFIPKHHFKAIILSARWEGEDLDLLVKTVVKLKPYADKVIVMGPRVLYRSPLPRLVAMSLIKHDPGLVGQGREDGQRPLDRKFAARLAGSGATYFSVYKAMCPDSDCVTTDGDGMPIQFDYGHLTKPGSVLIVEKLKTSGVL